MTHEMDGPEEVEASLAEAIDRIRDLMNQIENYSDPSIRRTVFELLDWFDALHRDGLERLTAGLRSVDFFDKALDDPVVAHLFSIYGLADVEDPRPLVEEALVEVQPYVHSHGGEIALVGIDAGVVSVQMHGACDQCPSSVVTLTQSLDTAIRERWPGLVRIQVENPPAPENSAWQPLNLPTRP